MVEWVEVKGRSVEVAVKAALEELGIDDKDHAQVKVLQEPQRGFLGIGRQDAIVHVKPRPKLAGRKSSRAKKRSVRKAKNRGSNKPQDRTGRSGKARTSKDKVEAKKPGKSAAVKVIEREDGPVAGDNGAVTALREEQAAVVKGFLVGLLDEFGLEGQVETSFDGRVLLVDVSGDQTEALIGPKASVMQAIHELTKTVVQRKTARNCRIRLDVAGYGERRRKALSIYAGQLADQVLDEGGEIMLEPMNAADRKVVHDAVSVVEGVRSYSEGAEPRRSVVISTER